MLNVWNRRHWGIVKMENGHLNMLHGFIMCNRMFHHFSFPARKKSLLLLHVMELFSVCNLPSSDNEFMRPNHSGSLCIESCNPYKNQLIFIPAKFSFKVSSQHWLKNAINNVFWILTVKVNVLLQTLIQTGMNYLLWCLKLLYNCK